MAHKPQGVSIDSIFFLFCILPFTQALNPQESEDLAFGSDDEEVKRKKMKVKKDSSSRRGT